MEKKKTGLGPMLNAYPDSLGGCLGDIAALLEREEVRGAFESFYILPSLYHYDLDRGFSVIDYDLNESLARRDDLERIKALGIDLKLDFVLNHASVNSPQFQDLLQKGDDSQYRDFFIDWNKFWAGCGEMTEEGYIRPEPKYLENMFFRKPGLPLLTVTFPDGSKRPYWNTFYQKVEETAGGTKYYGQMDLNIKSPLVWAHYEDTLRKLADYGTSIVRLDAFAYAPKEPGARNFLNEPGTWDFLERVSALAEPYGIALLPEIHESYDKKIHELVASKGYMIYDFFLPGLLLDALESGDGSTLAGWANELISKNMRSVTMLGCHDGIPLLDLKGLLPERRIRSLIDTVVARGGYVKDLHGQKNMYYQVNATYFSALGEDERKLLLARAIHLFMPGKPQVWYLDLFAGKNDIEGMRRAGEGGHKEINRTNLTREDMDEGLKRPVVLRQLELLRMRGTQPVFCEDADITVSSAGSNLNMVWETGDWRAELDADLAGFGFTIEVTDRETGETVYRFQQT